MTASARFEISEMMAVRIRLDQGEIDLLDLHGADFHEPFFQETVAAAQGEWPGAAAIAVSVERFLAAFRESRQPDGFLFHTGRCGSTLLANMLAASGDHVLIKEPDVISDLAAAWLGTEDADGQRRLAALTAATVRSLLQAAGDRRYRLLKFAAWNVRIAAALMELLPATPAVFLYRHPLETVASMMAQPPSWVDLYYCDRPLQARFFPTIGEIPAGATLRPAALFAHAWRSAAEAALSIPREKMLLLHYGELIGNPAASLGRVLEHLKHHLSPQQSAQMVQARQVYSKDPSGRTPFDPGGSHRRPPLSTADQALVNTITQRVWERLEVSREETANAY